MKTLTHRDQIHGDVRYDPLSVAILDTPVLQRLGRVYGGRVSSSGAYLATGQWFYRKLKLPKIDAKKWREYSARLRPKLEIPHRSN